MRERTTRRTASRAGISHKGAWQRRCVQRLQRWQAAANGLRATLVLPFFQQQKKGRKECRRHIRLHPDMLTRRTLKFINLPTASDSMNFGRAQRWHAGRRIMRKRTIQRIATSGRGFRTKPPCRDAACSGSSGGRPRQHKRLTRYACTPFLSTAKEREERMPPLNPPPSRHAGASDAKIHKLAYGFGQYEFWPRPTLACRAADNAETHYPADCNVSAFSFVPFCSPSRPFLHTVMPAAEPAPCGVSAGMMMARCDGTNGCARNGLRARCAALVLPFFQQQKKGRKECRRHIRLHPDMLTRRTLKFINLPTASDSMNFGRAQRWPAGRRIRRKRTTQRTATSGRGFAHRRMVETLRAASPIMATTCKKKRPSTAHGGFPARTPKKTPPKNLEFLKNIITFAAITKQT